MAIKIQFRRDTSTNWNSNNPILAEAELGFDTVKKQFKVGDGSTAWNSLDWLKTESEDIQDLIGAMTGGNTENGISVSYDDVNGKIDFDVNDPLLSISGDATGSSTMSNLGDTDISITHADTGVTAGSYGSSSQVPVLTVDSKGRLTSASTTAVAGVSSVTYAPSSGELEIATSDGSTHTVDLGVGESDSPDFTNITIASADVATQNYVDTAVSNLIGGAPGALDTLNELAAAIDDDASYAATVTSSLASATTDRALIRTEMAANETARDTDLATLQADVDQNEADSDTAHTAATTDRALIRTEMATNETDRDTSEAAAIAVETSRAQTAEAAIQSDVDANELASDNAHSAATVDRAAIRTEMATNETDRDTSEAAAILVEKTRALAAEAAIQSDVDTNESDSDTAHAAATSDRAAIRSEMSANETARDASEAAAILVEKTRALAAEAAIQSDVDTNEADSDALHSAATADRAAIRSEMSANETARDTSQASDIQTAIDNVIDGAPGTLDTLNEIAAAIADDTNYATTLTSSLATKTDKVTTLTAGTGLTGGGDLSQSRTFNLANTAVTAGTYGDASAIGTFVVDNQGRITSAGTAALNSDNVLEGSNNLFYTHTRARGAISASGDLSYNSGVVSFTERTDSEVRGLISASGSLSYNSSTGVISYTQGDTDTVSEGSANLYYTNTRARSAISASGSLSYNSSTGDVSFTERTDSEVRGLISASGSLSYNSSTGVFSFTQGDTDTVSEGSSNLYYTDARARSAISVSGDISYNSTTGVISTTGLASSDTDDLNEGSTNLYFTSGRARGAISASGSLSYNSSTGDVSYTERTTEELQDLVGAMVSSNSESGVSVTYDDTNGKLNFNVNDPTITLAGDVSGSATMSNLGNVSITATVADDSHNHTIANVDGLQTALDAKTTESYVDTQISNVIGSAPAALDTLNEIAAAINDDANYAGTITSSLATKVDKVSGKALSANDFTNTLKSKLDGIASSANNYSLPSSVIHESELSSSTSSTSTTTAANSAAVKAAYDIGNHSHPYLGSTSKAADSEKLDGLDSSQFMRSDTTDTHDQRVVFNACANQNYDDMATSTGSLGALEVFNSGSGNDAFMTFHAGGDYACYFGLDADSNDLAVGGWSKGAVKYKMWHAGNDGAGSGLDADKLDGVQASQFVQYFQSTSAPSTTTNGTMWFDTSDDTLYQRQDGTWVQVSTEAAPAIPIYNVSGTIVN